MQSMVVILITFLSTLSLRRATSGHPGTRRHDVISIHALLAESDKREANESIGTLHFYPRSPCGERRLPALASINYAAYFYPRSPCGERHDTSSLMQCQAKFLSTLSLRRATIKLIINVRKVVNFYPRSPCGERRLQLFLYYQDNRFLSTLSLRRATQRIGIRIDKTQFLSTLSLRRATQEFLRVVKPSYNFYPRSPCGERL